MGNETNLENWAARERLRWVEVTLWWRGWVGRSDLRALFGISAAQASSDLQRYAELNPSAMSYQTSRKRYESGPRMRCVLHEPQLGEGLGFLEEDWDGGTPGVFGNAKSEGHPTVERVATLELPRRRAKPAIARRMVLAAIEGREVKVNYYSVASGTARKRSLVPRGFGWDGHRWHTRAWCCENEEWRDFVLGRIESVEWPGEVREELPKDEAWCRIEVIQLVINPKLKKESREALRLDYGLTGEVLELRVRAAMKPYLLAGLFLDEESGRNLPRHFVLGE
ncbi:WYL domain-containing protein [Roseibacillus persicicus]|uniref:Transcriptional regulator n=1 Tax=Roseibacillus persicicus TaxID=454148 RepID=A0A918WIP5_9BACT|nr:WYL domain-containing protein [Roseibacillus persicicus]GHC49885.1 transcriptional regulator [Roseibacillus persicicus]